MSSPFDDLIDERELAQLRSRYGPFPRHDVRLAMSAGSLAFYRRAFRKRRGEILFVLQRPDGDLLLHTKHSYPAGVYRLPGGGIERDEPVRHSLAREVLEETQFSVADESFLGLIAYEFTGSGPAVRFVSYVFQIPNIRGEPVPLDDSEGISDFRWLPPGQLPEVATVLKNLADDAPGRSDWGRFRAVGHDFVAGLDF